MNLVSFNINEISIPFRYQFKHALAARNRSSSVIFEIIADNGMRGFGEGTPREYVTGESIGDTVKTLRFVAEQLKNRTIDLSCDSVDIIKDIRRQLDDMLKCSPSARCAVELAMLDLLGKSASKSVLSFLGAQKTTAVSYSGVITDSKRSHVEQSLMKIQAFNIKQVKIKASNSFASDSDRFETIRSHLGADVEYRIDANGAWTLEEAIRRINFYNQHGVQMFEQPLPAESKMDYPVLMERIDKTNHILVDESVCTYDDAIWFIDNKGANGINLKISKHGGLLDTLLIHQVSSENGFRNQLGCHVGETSILTSAGLIFSALNEPLIAYEGAYGKLLLEFDLVDEPIQFVRCGKLDLSHLVHQIGLGLILSPTLLDAASVGKHQH